MPSVTFTETVTYVVWECIHCHVRFGVSQDFEFVAKRDKTDFYCPNGHAMAYREGEADRLRKIIREREERILQEIAAKTKAQSDALFYKAEADQAFKEAKRLKKRVSAGVCPCCTRTFQNLQRHMATKHPEVAK